MEGIFASVCSGETRLNGFKLREDKYRLDKRQKFFTVSVVRHWNRFTRKAVDTPSLEVPKARLDVALRNLVSWKVSLPTAWVLKLDGH